MNIRTHLTLQTPGGPKQFPAFHATYTGADRPTGLRQGQKGKAVLCVIVATVLKVDAAGLDGTFLFYRKGFKKPEHVNGEKLSVGATPGNCLMGGLKLN